MKTFAATLLATAVVADDYAVVHDEGHYGHLYDYNTGYASSADLTLPNFTQ